MPAEQPYTLLGFLTKTDAHVIYTLNIYYICISRFLSSPLIIKGTPFPTIRFNNGALKQKGQKGNTQHPGRTYIESYIYLTYLLMCIQSYIYMCVCVCPVRICVYVCMYVYVFMYICMYVWMDVWMYVCIATTDYFPARLRIRC